MKKAIFLALFCAAGWAATAQDLPDPLTANDGKRVRTEQEWRTVRRPELREFFEANMYGRAPQTWEQIRHFVVEEDSLALNGTATRRQIRIWWDGTPTGPYADVLVYLPNQVSGQIPVVLGLNFEGNHSVCTDPAIRIPEIVLQTEGKKRLDRGFDAGQWPVEEILRRGYGVATAWRNEVSLDNRARHMEGVRSVYPSLAEGDENWATVSAWAWGLSRIADILLQDERLDHSRLSVLGFSRLGKAALWAGATDERFAATVSVCSGAGGAKLLHRNEGEKVHNLVGVGYWFCRNFGQYANRDTELPFDSHQMMSLIAPRALYVASATQDGYADPPGEYAALQLTTPVYKLLKHRTALPKAFPSPDTPVGVGTPVGYHVRTGKHDTTPQDWKAVLDFLDAYWAILE
ncbi:hypothetical protein LJB87_03230, partial [Alistipes sp. OttesenSCG-928-L06]|nr:hypothetical protein [Alistipes sp. OttesenSCG-928-L06]